MTLSGNRVFVDVTKVRIEMRSDKVGVAPTSSESVLVKDYFFLVLTNLI